MWSHRSRSILVDLEVIWVERGTFNAVIRTRTFAAIATTNEPFFRRSVRVFPLNSEAVWPEFSVDLRDSQQRSNIRSTHERTLRRAGCAEACCVTAGRTLQYTASHPRPEHRAGGRPMSGRGVAHGRIGVAGRVCEVQEMNAHRRFGRSNLRAVEL